MTDISKPTITKYVLGEITHIQVRLPNRPAIIVARDDQHLSDDELIACAMSYWQARDREEAIANTLKQRYNKQVFIGFLPVEDIDTTLQGYYAYVLKDRKHNHKYQILGAISLG